MRTVARSLPQPAAACRNSPQTAATRRSRIRSYSVLAVVYGCRVNGSCNGKPAALYLLRELCVQLQHILLERRAVEAAACYLRPADFVHVHGHFFGVSFGHFGLDLIFDSGNFCGKLIRHRFQLFQLSDLSRHFVCAHCEAPFFFFAGCAIIATALCGCSPVLLWSAAGELSFSLRFPLL